MVREKCQDYISGNALLTIHSVLEATSRRTISLLTSDVNTRKLLGVSREAMEEVLKGPQNYAEVEGVGEVNKRIVGHLANIGRSGKSSSR